MLGSLLGNTPSITGDRGARSKYFRTTAAARWKRDVVHEIHEAAVVMDRQARVVVAAVGVDAVARRLGISQEPEFVELRQALVALSEPRRQREEP